MYKKFEFIIRIMLIASIVFLLRIEKSVAQSVPMPIALLDFEANSPSASGNKLSIDPSLNFTKGLVGKALNLSRGRAYSSLALSDDVFRLDPKRDFSVQCWVKTAPEFKNTAVILSQKNFQDNSLASQKNAGWALYTHGGTWAWNMGSGNRRITHERDNGTYQPLNDGKWHQLTMTYNAERSEIRLFYDGDNKALYNVLDSVGFDFSNNLPLAIGWKKSDVNCLPLIEKGATQLQELVDAFDKLGLDRINPLQLVDLVVDPRALFTLKGGELKNVDFAPVMKARAALMRNPYTVHQIKEFMELAPLLKIYSLNENKIVINRQAANAFIESERLHEPELDLDNLALWTRTLTPEEVLQSYIKYFKPAIPEQKLSISSITTADWNIWHGGKHFTVEKDGWDSRHRIAEIIRAQKADVIMMQETYSSGDFIAAELGYYFATTIDWDYLNQGANISVLSRYPIKELYVPKGAPFMNVAVKVAVSKTQDMYVMSNWYGMDKFPVVFDFHQTRFNQVDSIPVIFAGDFNAVPHTDGGESPASVKMLGAGFTDAYRNTYPDIQKNPGFSHNEGIRIDQLYYKGKGLKNTATRLIDKWPSGFPSDHFMILSVFDLNKAFRR